MAGPILSILGAAAATYITAKGVETTAKGLDSDEEKD